jgi:hypothetical protein
MKKTLLAISALAMSLAVQAQTVTGFILSYNMSTTPNDNCLVNIGVNSGGYAFADGNIASVASYNPATATYITVTSKSTGLAQYPAPGDFDIYKVYGSGATATCGTMRSSADPTNNLPASYIDMTLWRFSSLLLLTVVILLLHLATTVLVLVW